MNLDFVVFFFYFILISAAKLADSVEQDLFGLQSRGTMLLDVDPDIENWTVALKITCKSAILQRYKEVGTYMVVDVEDDDGTEARMIAHNNLAKKFENQIALGGTYNISNCALKKVDGQYQNFEFGYDLIMVDKTKVVLKTAPPTNQIRQQSVRTLLNSTLLAGSSGAAPAAPAPAPVANTMVKDLTPQSPRDWVVCAKVFCHSGIQTFIYKTGGEGQRVTIDVEDLVDGAKIRLVAFGALADEFSEKLQMGKSYFISGCSVKQANTWYQPHDHIYELHLTPYTKIIESQ